MKLGLEGNAPRERAKLQLLLTQKTPPPLLLDLGDARVNVARAPAYTHSFSVDGVPLLATDRVRPWREGYGGKDAESVGKTVLLPEDIKHWAKWDYNSLILNVKREAIMVMNFYPSLIFYFSPQVDTNFIIC